MKHTLNRPKIVKHVIAHLKTMKHRSGVASAAWGRSFFSCMYRTRGGNKCAIGVLMPDWIYSKDMEDTSIRDIFYNWPEVEMVLSETYGNGKPLTLEDEYFLDNLQVIHDDAASWDSNGITKNAVRAVKQLAQTRVS